MTQEVKILSIVGAATTVILIGAVFFLSSSSTSNTSSSKADAATLIKNDSNKLGTESAKIKFVEFGDYQCPACGAAYPIAKRLVENYKDNLIFVFRNYAFLGQESIWSAQSAECAGDQGKFWEFHNYLYEHQSGENKGAFSKDNLKMFAKTLNLDTSKFNVCLDSEKYASKVASDLNDGNSVGVNSTPTFFINGEKVVGVPSYDDLKAKMDTILKGQ